MAVWFDSKRCISQLSAYLGLALYKAAKEYLDLARSHMQTPEGAGSLQDISPNDVIYVAHAISVLVVGGAYAAMDNYGKGSLMDIDNPALEAYMNSDLWNPARETTEIVGRPESTYADIFGRTVKSSGKREGQSLEPPHGPFEPMPPSHALETAARWMEQEYFAEIVSHAISIFNFNEFFVINN